MTTKTLRNHLSEHCTEMNLQCLDCDEKQKRSKYKKHTTKTCMRILQERYAQQEILKPQLEQELADLQSEAARRRESRNNDDPVD